MLLDGITELWSAAQAWSALQAGGGGGVVEVCRSLAAITGFFSPKEQIDEAARGWERAALRTRPPLPLLASLATSLAGASRS